MAESQIEMPPTEDHLTTWQCKEGHKIVASYNMIDNGYGCPICEGDELKLAISRTLAILLDELSDCVKMPVPSRNQRPN